MVTEFDNVIIEAETLSCIYDYVKSYLNDTEEDLKWYKTEYKRCQRNGEPIEEWIENGIAFETKRKQVLLTTISKLYEQLNERQKGVLKWQFLRRN